MHLRRRTLLGAAGAFLAAPRIARAAERTGITLWHAMASTPGGELARQIAKFNASQNNIEVTGLFKGVYKDLLTAVAAAWRAGQAPHIAQVFEVGTETMMTSGPVIKPVWQLAQETGVKLDPSTYVPAVRGYYSTAEGRLMSMPFNSSTSICWYNQDAFEKAGLDPRKFPATWPELVANSVIGGASFWVLTAPKRSPAEYRAVAEFLRFLAEPANDAEWAEVTGYVPITHAGFGLMQKQGWLDKNPGADIPLRQLSRGHVTDNSRGFHLGRMPEIRTIIEEECEKALAGQQGAQAALDNAVERGNKVLRDFQRSVRT
jgi:ABC-type glycerol-3-phosphate transport system substrate-binding protein